MSVVLPTYDLGMPASQEFDAKLELSHSPVQFASILSPLTSCNTRSPLAKSTIESVSGLYSGHSNLRCRDVERTGPAAGFEAKESQRAVRVVRQCNVHTLQSWGEGRHGKQNASTQQGRKGRRTFHRVAHFVLVRGRRTAELIVRAEEQWQLSCGADQLPYRSDRCVSARANFLPLW